MTNIRPIDFRFLNDLFEMDSGYVLDFSNRTIAEFFPDELNVDIYDSLYEERGSSKANRVRCFLSKVDSSSAERALKALWEYRQVVRQERRLEETVPNAEGRFLELLNRVSGTTASPSTPPPPAFNRARIEQFKGQFAELTNLQPQARGYAFEHFLRDIFSFYGLEAQSAFRNTGEQIDGSFLLNSETYLIEAKWQNQLTGASVLHAFHGKVEQKAQWARGLFVSYSGFTEEGLTAFGRVRRVICMNGWDLHEALNREIPLDKVLERKVRRAAETGQAYISVRELFI